MTPLHAPTHLSFRPFHSTISLETGRLASAAVQHGSLGVAAALSAYRTATNFRAELRREDEQKWEWVIPKEEAEYSTSAQSAGSVDKRPGKEKRKRASPKNEAASNTAAKSARSDDSRPVLPTCSVLQQSCTKLKVKATGSVAVQTEDPINGSLSLWDWLTPATVTSTAT